jgi:CheY-like chemotaxis protein
MNEKNKKILVMEDDKRIMAALAIRLEASGYEVLTAPNGFEGLKLTLNERPDLIVMDIWMPNGIGFSVAQRLLDLGLTGIPLIFITGSKLAGLRETAEQLGAAAFFEKPYDSTELLEAISDALESDKAPSRLKKPEPGSENCSRKSTLSPRHDLRKRF